MRRTNKYHKFLFFSKKRINYTKFFIEFGRNKNALDTNKTLNYNYGIDERER